MYAEYRVVDYRREWHVVKELRAIPPYIYAAVLPHAFVVETVYLCDLPALVIAAQQCNAVRIPHLQSDQEHHRLQAVETTIDEIAQEQVICLLSPDISSPLKELLQIIELSVNITANLQAQGSQT